MIRPEEMWDEPAIELEDHDELPPTVVVIRAPKQTYDERLEQDRRALEGEYARQFPNDTKEAA